MKSKINSNIEEIFNKANINLPNHVIHRLKSQVNSSIVLLVDTENENGVWICDWECNPIFPCTEKYSIQDKQLEFKYLIQVAIDCALKNCNLSSETASQ